MLTRYNTALITGAAGFIASNFIRVLRERAPHMWIVGIDNFSTGRRDALPKGIDFYEGDINNPALLEKIFSKHSPDVVFHFAAIPPVPLSIKAPSLTTQNNLAATVALLEKSRDHKVSRFVFSSSAAVYGNPKVALVSEKVPPAPVSPYALQKYASELFVKQFADLYGMDTVSLRYFNVFGPGQYGDSSYSTVIARWLEQLYANSGKEITMEGDGKQSRDFCFIDNICEANIRALAHSTKFKGDVFNIGSGKRTDLLTVRAMIEKFSGKRLPLVKKAARIGDIKHSQADIKKATAFLKYRPLVTFEDGLRQTVEWFEERQK